MDKAAISSILSFLYGKEAAQDLTDQLLQRIEKNKPKNAGAVKGQDTLPFTHKDAFLITYGNILSANAEGTETGETGLARLYRFMEKRNKSSFSYLHILPFYPYTSDDGFSVVDYRQVDDRFGTWDDIEKLKNLNGTAALDGTDGKLKLVFDFVINHGSVKSKWFQGFLSDKEQYHNWYVTRPADYDYKTVVRPRTHPLLSEFTKSNGEKIYVWTTFSDDQVDYDFSNPQVLFEFIEILLDYANRGSEIVRLDAIAYLWKEDGTPCIHHPKTHAVVKLFRAIVDYLKLPMIILTETNVPHEENIAYFGKAVGDKAVDSLPEAAMVYNFALPPLTLYAAISGDAAPLRNWAKNLPEIPNQYFLNFLASHDGVGLTPARGLVDEAAFNAALEEAKRRGALINWKSTPQGDIPYELNCSYASMVAPPELGSAELRARAFLAVHGVLLSLSGLPAIYFHSWIGSEAWTEGPKLLGYNRAINRQKPPIDTVEKELDDTGHFRHHANKLINAFLAFRQKETVFNPDISQKVLESGADNNSLFVLQRGPSKEGRWALCFENLGNKKVLWKAGAGLPAEAPAEVKEISLEPWETRWVVWDKSGVVNKISSC